MGNKNIKISIVLPEELYLDIKTLAAQQDRSSASLIRLAVESYIENERIKEDVYSRNLERYHEEMIESMLDEKPVTITKGNEKIK